MNNRSRHLIAVIVSVVITSILFFTPLWYFGDYYRMKNIVVEERVQAEFMIHWGLLIGIPLSIIVYLLKRKENVIEVNSV